MTVCFLVLAGVLFSFPGAKCLTAVLGETKLGKGAQLEMGLERHLIFSRMVTRIEHVDRFV